MVTQNLLYHSKSQFHKFELITFINESMSHLLMIYMYPISISKCPHALLDYIFKEHSLLRAGRVFYRCGPLCQPNEENYYGFFSLTFLDACFGSEHYCWERAF